jgi:hypothetical protein
VSKVDLRLDWVGHDAAKFAVEHWHYSKRMPIGKAMNVGVWEDGQFIGVVLFARGANNALGDAYNLKQTEICELVRVALTTHKSPVSRVVSVALKMAQRQSDGLRLVVSYADQRQGHVGGIYQAMNWVYVGRGMPTKEFFHEGRWKHNREVTSGAFGKQRKVADYTHLPARTVEGKHKYLYPLDDDMRRQIEPLRKPYPKRLPANEAIQDAPGDQSGMGGASPTRSL